MSLDIQKYRRQVRYLLLAIALPTAIASSPLASAKLFDGPVDRLPVLERAALREGRVVITGDRGDYTARVLVTASNATTWEVLTDYNNFQQFLPNVVTSQVLATNGNQKIFEQVNIFRVFIITQRSRVRIAVTETHPKTIAFRLLEGDLGFLEGSWNIEPVSLVPGRRPDRILISHQVSVDPGSNPQDLFFSIYKESLADTLAALKQEIEKRSLK